MTDREAMLELVWMFPPDRGYRGAATRIVDIARLGMPIGRGATKAHAVRMIAQAEDWRQSSQGHGNRARRRINFINSAKN